MATRFRITLLHIAKQCKHAMMKCAMLDKHSIPDRRYNDPHSILKPHEFNASKMNRNDSLAAAFNL